MTTFDDIQKNMEKVVSKEVDARTKGIQDAKDKIIALFKEAGLSVEDSSITLNLTQKAINASLVERPLSDFL